MNYVIKFVTWLVAGLWFCPGILVSSNINRGSRGYDRMVVGFSTTCVISAYNHKSCEFESSPWWGVLDSTLCDKVCQWFATGQCFFPGTPVFSTNKTDRHNITETLLNVRLNTITLAVTQYPIKSNLSIILYLIDSGNTCEIFYQGIFY